MERSYNGSGREWITQYLDNPRPGASDHVNRAYKQDPSNSSLPFLSPVVEFVDFRKLQKNPLNDFPPLPDSELEDLQNDILRNGITDPLIVKRNDVLLTGENRLNAVASLAKKGHTHLEKVPVRYCSYELGEDEEYEFIEGDNLLRRHLSPAERRRRLIDRIKRLYPDQLTSENRGRKKIESQFSKTGQQNLAEEIGQRFSIPKGTAQDYLATARSEVSPYNYQAGGYLLKALKSAEVSERFELRNTLKEVRKLRKQLRDDDQLVREATTRLKGLNSAKAKRLKEAKKVQKKAEHLIEQIVKNYQELQ